VSVSKYERSGKCSNDATSSASLAPAMRAPSVRILSSTAIRCGEV
jgi:hypothetical protein